MATHKGQSAFRTTRKHCWPVQIVLSLGGSPFVQPHVLQNIEGRRCVLLTYLSRALMRYMVAISSSWSLDMCEQTTHLNNHCA